MLLGLTFLCLSGGFALMIVGWVMMLAHLARYPMPPAQTPMDGWTRWMQFMRGYGGPAEGEPQRKLIARMFQVALILFGLMIVFFFAAGGPDALPAPPEQPKP
ncbi:MAG: hypothetical protein K2X34_09475 [Hyphomonadaceae bacterium]|nr:hypothetical protein [Hyphomonadaceae bacterium]